MLLRLVDPSFFSSDKHVDGGVGKGANAGESGGVSVQFSLDGVTRVNKDHQLRSVEQRDIR